MKRKLIICLFAIMSLFMFNSCDVYTYATTQDDIYIETDVDIVRSNVSFDIIIRYGIPYYRDGILLYYLYKDIYYYPFYYNNYWYVRAYRRPFTHFDTKPYFRPHRYDYKFSPGSYRGFDRPRDHNVHHRSINQLQPRREIQRRPNNLRPNVQPRQSIPNTRSQQPRPQRQMTPRTQPQHNGNSGIHRGGKR